MSLKPGPRPQYTANIASANDALRSILSIYLVLALGPTVRFMTTYLVDEKEKKLRDGMLMMGLQYSVFWSSWAFTYLLVEFVSCVGMVAVLYGTGLLSISSPTLTFILLASFAMSLIPFSMAFSTLFSTAKTAGGAVNMAVTLLALPFFAVVAYTPETSILWLGALFSPLAFCLGMDATWSFDGDWGGVHGMTASNMHMPGPLGFSWFESVAMLWLDSALYLLLALYLDNVVPQEVGTHKPATFIFMPKFWRNLCCPNRTEGSGRSGGIGERFLSSNTELDSEIDGENSQCAREEEEDNVQGAESIVVLHRVTKVRRLSTVSRPFLDRFSAVSRPFLDGLSAVSRPFGRSHTRALCTPALPSPIAAQSVRLSSQRFSGRTCSPPAWMTSPRSITSVSPSNLARYSGC